MGGPASLVLQLLNTKTHIARDGLCFVAIAICNRASPKRLDAPSFLDLSDRLLEKDIFVHSEVRPAPNADYLPEHLEVHVKRDVEWVVVGVC